MSEANTTGGRNILLTGMMGSGKSTIGRLVAGLTARRFIDTDEAIEAASGRSIAEIFAADGEEAFRAIEHEVLADVVATQQAIIALGGGVLTDPRNVEVIRREGVVIFIDAPMTQLVQRLSQSRKPGKRPLLGGELDPAKLHERLTAIRHERLPAYTSAADYILDPAGRASSEVATEVYEWARVTPGVLTPQERD